MSTLKTVTDTMNRLVNVPTSTSGNVLPTPISAASVGTSGDTLPTEINHDDSFTETEHSSQGGGGEENVKETDTDAPGADIWENAFKKEKVGADVSPELQEFVSQACTSEPDPDFMKKVKEKHLMPGNCPVVTTPAIHKRVWRALGHKGREADLERKKIHQNTLTGLYASLTLTDKISALRKERPEDPVFADLELTSKECVYLQGYACYTHSLHRREHLRPAFNLDYRSLCNRDQVLSENMFSKEFSKDCKELSEANKAVDAALSNPDAGKQGKGKSKGKSSTSSKNNGGGKWKSSNGSNTTKHRDNHPYNKNHSYSGYNYDSYSEPHYNHSNNRGRGGQSFRGRDRSTRGGSQDK